MNPTVLMVRCRECGTKYRLHDYEPGGDLPDCPECGRRDENKLDLTRPVRIHQGGSPQSQAIKIAEDIATKDYGLTDFKTGKLADGEAMAKDTSNMTPTQRMMDSAWKNAGRNMGMPAGGPSLLDGVRASGGSGEAVRNTEGAFRAMKNTKIAVRDMVTGRRVLR